MSAPWMPFYVADYVADTQHLSTIEHGAYLLLIMHYWRCGGLPSDERQLQRICRMTTREWAASRDTLAAFFEDGWRHGRIEKEREKAAVKAMHRAESGKRGGSAKALKSKDGGLANARGLPEQNRTIALPSSSDITLVDRTLPGSDRDTPSPNTVGSIAEARPNATVCVPEGQSREGEASPPDKPEPKPRNEYPPGFKLLWSEWSAIPTESKKIAFERWRRLSQDDRERCLDGVMAYEEWHKAESARRGNRGPPPRVHLSTFISERRWENLLATEYNKHGMDKWRMQAH